MTESIRYSLIGHQDINWGTGTFNVTLADGSVVAMDQVNLSLANLDVVTYANLPSDATAGRFALVTDRGNSLYIHDGTAWRPSSVLPETFTQATLPTAGVAGRLRRVSDNTRGLYMDTGTQWVDLNRRVRNAAAANVTADGTTDDYTALQTLLDEVAAQADTAYVRPRDEVALPPGTIKISQPLVMNGIGMGLSGAGQYRTMLQPTYAGPALVLCGPAPKPIPTQASLATGAGVAFTLGTAHRFNLSDVCSINGLAAMTVEFFVAPTGGGAGRVWMDSRGYVPTFGTTDKPALILGTWGGSGEFQASMTVGGTQYDLQGTTIPADDGTVYHVAVTYDGTNVKLWVNGALEQTAATGGGTVTQGMNQDLTIGRNVQTFPEGGNYTTCGTGAIDSVRISNTARYTGAFTAPTAKFTDDANTVFLCNFDNIVKDILVECDVITSSFTKGWMLFRDTATLTTQGPYMHLRDFAVLSYVGVIAHNTWRSRFERLTIWAGVGLLLLADCWESDLTSLHLEAAFSERYGLGGGVSGMLDIQAPKIIGFKYLMAFGGGVSGTILAPWLETATTTLHAFTTSNTGETSYQLAIIGPVVNTESGGTSLVNAFALQGAANVTITGGMFETLGTNGPPIRLQGTTNLTLVGTGFKPKATTTSIIEVADGTPNITLVNCNKTETGVPWEAASAIYRTHGFGNV